MTHKFIGRLAKSIIMVCQGKFAPCRVLLTPLSPGHLESCPNHHFLDQEETRPHGYPREQCCQLWQPCLPSEEAKRLHCQGSSRHRMRAAARVPCKRGACREGRAGESCSQQKATAKSPASQGSTRPGKGSAGAGNEQPAQPTSRGE